MNRVAVSPQLIRWAQERSGLDAAALVGHFPKLPQWESGELQRTYLQLEDYARATLTPFGLFFLPEPPTERLPVPDFRTLRNVGPRRPSAALLKMISQIHRAQERMPMRLSSRSGAFTVWTFARATDGHSLGTSVRGNWIAIGKGRDALEHGRGKPYDPDHGKKYAK